MAPHPIAGLHLRQLLKQLRAHHDNRKGSNVDADVKFVPVEELTPEQREQIERHISSVSDSQLDGQNSSSDSSRPKKRRYKKDIALKAAGGIAGVLIFGGMVAGIVVCCFPAAIPIGVPIVGGLVVLGLVVAAGLLYATSISNAVELKRIRRSVEEK